MNLLEKLNKREELARTEGRKLVDVYQLSEQAGVDKANEIGEANIIVVDEAPVVFRTCIVNDVKVLGEVKGKDDVMYTRVQLIGRDTATNQTLRTWTIVAEGNKMYDQGDLAEFPAVHIPMGKAGFANGTLVTPRKPEGCYQHTGQKTAERWNAIRMEGYAKATAATITGQKATAAAGA